MVAIIINPVSGGASPAEVRRRTELAASALQQAGLSGRVFVTERRGHARELARAAVERGDRLVVAWGGDGTVNEVASSLVATGVALGIVPSGSGNGLARELRLPSAAPAAIADALRAPARPIDAGQLGDRWFFSIAGIGFDAHVADVFDRRGGSRGLPAYVRIAAREFLRYRCGRYQVDERAAAPALLIVFANSAQWGNGARIAPAARVDDGVLDMVVVEERSRAAMIRQLPRLFTGAIGRVPGVWSRRITTAVIESDVPMLFHVDGEPCAGGTRLEARVRPGVLRVAG